MFDLEYIKKLVDESGKRCLKRIRYTQSEFEIEFYPGSMDAVEPAVKATVAVKGGPLGLGLLEEEFGPDNVTWPGAENKQ